MQHLIMFVLDDGGDSEITKERLEEYYREHVAHEWGNGMAVASRPVVVELTTPDCTYNEEAYILGMVAEMQEQISEQGSTSEED